MKRLIRQSEKRTGFTIVELLTVMSIIIILIGLLVPSLNMVRRYATDVKQRAQFHSIEAALELFKNEPEFGGYPDSAYKQSEFDEGTSVRYPGAARLCEAMVGQDLLGCHPASHFRSDGAGTDARDLYGGTAIWSGAGEWENNLKARKGPYIPLERAHAFKLSDIYGTAGTGGLKKERFVLCDEYARVKNTSTGKRIGMPILYYKANTSGVIHDSNTTYLPVEGDNKGQFYNYLDNDYLVELGMPWNPSAVHPMFTEPARFYESTKNDNIANASRPYKADSYILMSAGFDGQYGTPDDIFNFEKQ